MVRYCTSGLLYFTRRWLVKYSPQVQYLTILHSSSCNDNNYTNTKRDDHNIGNLGAAMVELIIALDVNRVMPTLVYHFGDWEYGPSGAGIDATERL